MRFRLDRDPAQLGEFVDGGPPADVEARVASGKLNWGSAKEVTDHLIAAADHAGANAVLLNVNVGAMPHRQFLEQIRRFGRGVLPALKAHEVKRVPAADRSGASAA